MKSIFLKFLFLFFCLLNVNLVIGQLQINPQNNVIATTCNNQVFSVQIDNLDQVNATSVLEFEVAFNENLDFIPATGWIIDAVNNTAVIDVGPINAASSVTITFTLQINCEVITVLNDNDPNTPNELSNDYSISSGNTVLATDSEDFEVEFPILNMVQPANTHNETHVGDVFTRALNITNVGNTDFNGSIRFEDLLNNCNSIQTVAINVYLNGILIPSLTASNSQVIDITGFTLPFGNNDVLTIEQEIEVVDCLSDCNLPITSNFDLTWGCNSNNLCISENGLAGTIVQDNETPEIVVYRTDPTGTAPWQNYCINPVVSGGNYDSNDLVWHEIVCVNEGEVTAVDFRAILRNLVNDNSYDLVFQSTVNGIHSSNLNQNIAPDIINLLSTTPLGVSNCATSFATQSPIDQAVWENIDLAPNESFSIIFATYRCCPDDDFLFNANVFFDVWTLDHNANQNDYTDPCEIVNYSYIEGQENTANGLFDPNYPRATVLFMAQQLFIGATHLTGNDNPTPNNPEGGCNTGETTEYQVHNLSFNPNDIGGVEQLFAASLGASPTGQIRIDFNLEPGVRLESPATFIDFNQVGGITLQPQSVTINQAYSGTTNSEVSVFFNIDAFATYDEFREYMNNAHLNFSLTPCCSAPPNSLYTVQLYINPEEDGCAECWIPLSEVQGEVSVHCPGCVVPGIITNSVEINRTTFGFPDDDNDGLANDNSTMITNPNTIPFAFATKNAMPGDNLNLVIESFAIDGNNNGGITYDSLLENWNGDTLKYLNIEIFNSCSDINSFDWNVIDQSLTITSPNYTASPVTVDLTPYEERDGGVYFYSVSMDDISAATNLPNNYFFQMNENYEVEVNYTICGNDDTADYQIDCPIEVRLSFRQEDITINQITSFADAPQVNQVYLISNPSATISEKAANLDGSFRFICEGYGDQISLYRLYEQNFSSWDNRFSVNQVTCTKAYINEHSIYIGGPEIGDHNNLFPFEYRPINSEFISLEIPDLNGYSTLANDGIIITSFTPILQNGAWQNNLRTRLIDFDDYQIDFDVTSNTNTVTFNQTPYQIAFENIASNQSGTIVNDQLVARGDELFRQILTVIYQSDPNCPDNAQVQTMDNEDFTYTYQLAGCNNQDIEITSSDAPQPNVTFLNPPAPVFNNPVVPGSIVSVFNDGCFDIILEKSTPFNERAENAYFFLEDLQNISITSLTFQIDNQPPTTIPNYNFELVELGDLFADEVVTITICYAVTTCDDALLDEIEFNFGWQCNEYPTLPLTNPCNLIEEVIELELLESNLSTGPVFQDNTVALCDSANFQGCTFAEAPGFIDDVFFIVEFPEGGQVLNPTISVPTSTNNPVTVQPFSEVSNGGITTSTYLVPFQPFILTTQDPAETVCIEFDMYYIPPCSGNVTTPPSILVGGIEYCGDTILSELISFQDLTIQGDSCVPIDVSSNVIDANCGNNGSIELIVTGADPFTYVWNPDLGTGNSNIANNLPAGNYSVTITDAQMCEEQLTFTIVDTGGFALSIAQNLDTCQGNWILTAQGGSSWEWSTTETTQSIVVSQTGTYTVTATENGCSITESININTLPTAPNNNGYTLVIPDNSSASQFFATDWVNANILVQGNLIVNQPTIIDNSNLYFTAGAGITIENNNTLEILNSSLDALISPCDTMWRGVTVAAGGTLIANNNTNFSNAMYAILSENNSAVLAQDCNFKNNFIGLFQVPQNYDADNAHVSDSLFFSNNKFWGEAPGLLHQYEGFINVPFDLVNHTSDTFDISPGKLPLAGIRSVNFRFNRVLDLQFSNMANGIYLSNDTAGYNNFTIVGGNIDSMYRLDFNGMLGYSIGVHGYGIRYINGTNTATANLNVSQVDFAFNRYDVYTKKSSLAIRSCSIVNNRLFSIYADDCIDCGFVVSNSNFTDYPFTNHPYYNPQYLIRLRDFDHSLSSNIGYNNIHLDKKLSETMIEMINVSQSLDTGRIFRNNIYANDVADNLFKFQNVENLSVYNNNIEADKATYGIKINSSNNIILHNDTLIAKNIAEDGVKIEGGDHNFVRDNLLTIEKGNSVIFLTDEEHTEVYRNNITMGNIAGNSPDHGILVTGVDSIVVATNEIFEISGNPVNNTDTLTAGIAVSLANNSLFECNDLNRTNVGMLFNHTLDNLAIKGNIFRTHGTGLLYLGNVVGVGAQTNAGNQWVNDAAPIASGGYGGKANNFNYNSSQTINFLEYFISTGPPSPFFPADGEFFPSSFNSFVSWFTNSTSGTDFDCVNSDYKSLSGGNVTYQNYYPIIQDLYVTESFTPSLLIEAKQQLYQNLQNDNYQLGADSIIDAFITQENWTNDSIILYVDQLWHWHQDWPLPNNVTTHQQVLANLLDSIHYVDSVYYQNNQNLVNFNNIRTTLTTELNWVKDSIGMLMNEYYWQKNQIANAAVQSLTQIAPYYMHDYYKQQVRLFEWYPKANYGVWDTASTSNIGAIANLCPFEGGKAVYTARTLYQNILDTSLVWDDAAICTQAGYEVKLLFNDLITQKTIITLFPNPAQENIEFIGLEDIEYQVQIVDIQGRLILETVISKEQASIDINHLDTGIYWAKLLNNQHLDLPTFKFIKE